VEECLILRREKGEAIKIIRRKGEKNHTKISGTKERVGKRGLAVEVSIPLRRREKNKRRGLFLGKREEGKGKRDPFSERERK